MRLIDADELKNKLPKTYHSGFENCRECRLLEREEVNAFIDNQSTVDAVPVTRCGDCKYYDTEYHCKLNGYGCGRSPDWFCADGKKEEEECTSTGMEP